LKKRTKLFFIISKKLVIHDRLLCPHNLPIIEENNSIHL